MPGFISLVLAQAQPDELPVRQSTLAWFIGCLGNGAPVLGLAALVVLVGACVVIGKARRPELVASYAIFLPIPFLVGFYCFVDSILSATVIINPPGRPMNAWELNEAVSTSFGCVLAGLLASCPAYAVVLIGWTYRVCGEGGEAPERVP